MKKIFWTITAALVLMLAACGSLPPSLAAPTPGKVSTPAPSQASPEVVVASAKVQPAQESRISFAISAPVKEVLVKEGDTVIAGQTLITLYTPDLEGKVTQAELAEKAGALEFTYWIPHRFDRPPEREWQAKAEWDQTKTALEIAKANLGQSSISAPFAGVVIEVKVKAGEFAQAGQAVITIADTVHMQIKTTDLSERDVPQVQIGQPAKIHLDALNMDVTGKVIRIAPKSETVGGDTVYPVTIELDQQMAGLLWGMNAEVEITVK